MLASLETDVTVCFNVFIFSQKTLHILSSVAFMRKKANFCHNNTSANNSYMGQFPQDGEKWWKCGL